jgi:hypothetical protein
MKACIKDANVIGELFESELLLLLDLLQLDPLEVGLYVSTSVQLLFPVAVAVAVVLEVIVALAFLSPLLTSLKT